MLFKKAAIFSDIHFGKKSDSEQFNQDCTLFIDWFTDQVNEHDCDTILFLGDWFDNRTRIRIDTMWYSNESINKLIATNRPIYWIIGNHDMYFRTHRGVHSLPNLIQHPQINLINEIIEINDVLFCPWLLGHEKNQPPSYDVKYVFGHFELPTFLMNQMIEMPDNGGIHADHFDRCEHVFSGHFHKQQTKTNEAGVPITYVGSPFGHDFNDVNDKNRGMMILEWNKEPFFINYKNGPNYNRIKLSTLLSIIEKNTLNNIYNTNSIIECIDDVNIDLEDVLIMKESLKNIIRDVKFPSIKDNNDLLEENTDIEVDNQNVDDMVIDHLRKLTEEETQYDGILLTNIYKNSIME